VCVCQCDPSSTRAIEDAPNKSKMANGGQLDKIGNPYPINRLIAFNVILMVTHIVPVGHVSR